MKLENQVVSLDLAKRLTELGVKQESLFWWTDKGLMSNEWMIDSGVGRKEASAFTVAELGEMLPRTLKAQFSMVTSYMPKEIQCGYLDYNNEDEATTRYEYFAIAYTEADARAKMLIYLLENKLI
jgi:hypothetical protein